MGWKVDPLGPASAPPSLGAFAITLGADTRKRMDWMGCWVETEWTVYGPEEMV